MRDLLRYLQMGIFTLDQQEFDELAESRTTYFENAQILHEIIAEEVEAERERIQEDGKAKSSFQTHLPRKSGQISWNVSKSTRQENRWKKRIGKR